MGTSNTVDWEHWLDHVHISIPNCPANCVELPPDLTPPSQVTGVIVTSTTSTGATLSWAPATDNVGVVGYQTEQCLGAICTDFPNLSSTSTPSITLSALSGDNVSCAGEGLRRGGERLVLPTRIRSALRQVARRFRR